MERPALLHLAFQALDAFAVRHGRLPAPGSREDGDALLAAVHELAASAPGPQVEVEEQVVRWLASTASGQLNPMAAMIGGFVGQEVVKAASGKFHPLHQWLYFDSIESLPAEIPEASQLAPRVRRRGSMRTGTHSTVPAAERWEGERVWASREPFFSVRPAAAPM